MFDDLTYRWLGRVAPSATGLSSGCGILVTGPWPGCRILVNELTHRLFLPAAKRLVTLDAGTGAQVRAVPMSSWGRGSLDILPGSHDVVAVPYAPGR